jgi:hypothetical protein
MLEGIIQVGRTVLHLELGEEFGGNRASGYTRGDWCVSVPQGVDRPNNTYEVHFVSTNTSGESKLVATLLEETLDKKKITKSVPLVHIEASDVND